MVGKSLEDQLQRLDVVRRSRVKKRGESALSSCHPPRHRRVMNGFSKLTSMCVSPFLSYVAIGDPGTQWQCSQPWRGYPSTDNVQNQMLTYRQAYSLRTRNSLTASAYLSCCQAATFSSALVACSAPLASYHRHIRAGRCQIYREGTLTDWHKFVCHRATAARLSLGC